MFTLKSCEDEIHFGGLVVFYFCPKYQIHFPAKLLMTMDYGTWMLHC